MCANIKGHVTEEWKREMKRRGRKWVKAWKKMSSEGESSDMGACYKPGRNAVRRPARTPEEYERAALPHWDWDEKRVREPGLHVYLGLNSRWDKQFLTPVWVRPEDAILIERVRRLPRDAKGRRLRRTRVGVFKAVTIKLEDWNEKFPQRRQEKVERGTNWI